jgi:fatty acid CoA ligase FadD9
LKVAAAIDFSECAMTIEASRRITIVLPRSASATFAAGMPPWRLGPAGHHAETEPTVLAVAVNSLATAVDVVIGVWRPRRIAVIDHRPGDGEHEDAIAAASARLAKADPAVPVQALPDVLAVGRSASSRPRPDRADNADGERLALLVYTSGSSGTPKGAMYPERAWIQQWLALAGLDMPCISLAFLPMSHTGGRASVYTALGAGGTVYFAATADLSSFLDDLALTRPTQLTFVPRIWQMLHSEYPAPNWPDVPPVGR